MAPTSAPGATAIRTLSTSALATSSGIETGNLAQDKKMAPGAPARGRSVGGKRVRSRRYAGNLETTVRLLRLLR